LPVNGSGLPNPEKGFLSISFKRLLIRFNVFYPESANTDNHPMLHHPMI